MRKYLKNMFGFIVTEPIYVSLSHMRAIHIAALYITADWTERLMLKIPPLAPNADAVMIGVYFTNFLALVTIYWKAIHDAHSSNDQ